MESFGGIQTSVCLAPQDRTRLPVERSQYICRCVGRTGGRDEAVVFPADHLLSCLNISDFAFSSLDRIISFQEVRLLGDPRTP